MNKGLLVVAVVIITGGCFSLPNTNKIFNKGSEGYNRAIKHLQEIPDGQKFLAKNPQPRVITVASNGSIYVYPEDRYGYQEFTKSGSSFSGYSFIDYAVPDIAYQGWKEHDRLKKIDDDNRERQRLLDVDNAIKNPRKISMEEFLGIKLHENLKPRLNFNQSPDVSGNFETYWYNQGKVQSCEELLRSRTETVPNLKVLHGFELYKIMLTHSTGELFSYTLMGTRSIPFGEEYEQKLTALLRDVKAFMWTDKEPEFSESITSDHKMMRTWRWKEFETLDNQFFDVSLSAFPRNPPNQNTKGYWSLIFTIYPKADPAETARKRAEYEAKLERRKSEEKEASTLSKRLDGPMRDLYNRVKNQLAIVKTNKGVGSGFLVNDKDRIYLYTNEHVVRGADKPTVLDLCGNKIELGDFELAKNLDMVRFAAKNRTDGLLLSSQNIDLDTPITVFGNSDGAGVATALNGKVLGLGPTLLEVSAEFVQGNSGSPVLSLDGQVLGVVAFAVNAAENENWLKKDTRFNGVRRFALRVTNATWTKMDWELYSTIVNR